MRVFLKRTALLASIIAVSPFIAVARAGLAIGSESAFNSLACLLSLIPGRTGSYMRLGYYKGTLKNISPDVYIGFGSFFSRPGAEVGRNVTIGAYCILGTVVLKDGVMLASRVSIPSGKYQHGGAGSSQEDAPPRFDKVTIGQRTWIGEGAVILSDVGSDCIIGAGSVVTRPIPDGFVAAGNPARPTLKRGGQGSAE